MRDNGGVQGYRDDGVVLRTQKLGEADRIITLLTRHNGRVRAVARGIRRTKSRFGARLEPFTHVDVMIHPGRSLDVITQAEVIRAYGTPLVIDYPKYTAGTAMLETAERFTPIEKEPAIRQFLLLVGGLRALGDAIDPPAAIGADDPGEPDPSDPDDASDPGNPGTEGSASRSARPCPRTEEGGSDEGASPRAEARAGVFGLRKEGARNERLTDEGKNAGLGRAEANGESTVPRDPRMVLDAYFLRSLTFAGYAPALEACARCGAPGTTDAVRTPASDSDPDSAVGAKPLVAFAIAAGGMVCAGCRPPGSASPAPPTVALMIALLRGNWDEALRSERRHRVECSGLVAAYLQWHLEHSIRSLRHVERA